MSYTVVQIYNRVLRLLGVASLVATTDDVEPADILNDIYAGVLDEVEEEHPWNFCMKRASLTELGGAITSWTDGGSNVWYASLSYTPAEVLFDGTEGNEQTALGSVDSEHDWYYDSAADLLYVYSTSDPSTAFTTVFAQIPEFDWTYAFGLPSDYLRVIKMESNAEFVIEGSMLFTDESAAKIQYIARITDTTKFPNKFIGALVARLAAEVAYPLTNDKKTMEDMFSLYGLRLSEAKAADAQEGTPQYEDNLEWENARL